ncbi:hypothetical protein QR680_012135 [Steinernema hermaphroditum]|uniref:Tyrosine-protein kinase n=1 Tax=Steinernema hermaphroditum TaxID=289476 RepID=A0AA39LZC2_9BILA|nr:hypothetical protein QR680_012135 [Steinernema hermaphroditum]
MSREPSRYSSDLIEQDWYHGMVLEEHCTKLLRKRGDFLVRAVGETADSIKLILSVRSTKSSSALPCPILHLNLDHSEQNGWTLEAKDSAGKDGSDSKPKCFPTLAKLIQNYKEHSLPDASRLIRGCPRPPWFISHSQMKFYSHGDRIGSGNFCVVYKGNYKRCDVAIKVCQPRNEQTASEDVEHRRAANAKRQLLQEGSIMANLTHPNIITFIGICCDQPPVCIVMELCTGGSLIEHLFKFGDEISIGERVEYCNQASNGMAYLHSKNLVHRDLAARNCLFNVYGILKIADFGLSKILNNVLDKNAKGKGGDLPIPLRWMAPEGLREAATVSQKSDVWSFGVVMFEIFNNGQRPWNNDDEWPLKRIATHIRKGIMPVPPEKTPESLKQLMKACWRLDPAERSSFAEINNTIRKIKCDFAAPLPAESTLAKVKGVRPLSLDEYVILVEKARVEEREDSSSAQSMKSQKTTRSRLISMQRSRKSRIIRRTDRTENIGSQMSKTRSVARRSSHSRKRRSETEGGYKHKGNDGLDHQQECHKQ